MTIRIQSALTSFAFDVAATLEARGVGPVSVEAGEPDAYALHYRPTLSAGEVSKLLEALAPLQPDGVVADPELQDADAELLLGVDAPLGDCGVTIYADSEEWAQHLRELTGRLGFAGSGYEVRVLDEDVLLYNEAPPLFRQLVRWYLEKAHVRPQERQEPAWEGNLGLVVRDPNLAGKSFLERFKVEIASDDEAAAERLVERLSKQGFRLADVVPLTATEARRTRINLDPGPFTKERAPAEFARLHVAVDDLVAEEAIDASRFPVQMSTEGPTAMAARITLPLKACKTGKKRPYSGPYPERFRITIITDSPAAVAGLQTRLKNAGFDRVFVEQVEPGKTRSENPFDDSFIPGFAIVWKAAGKLSSIADAIRGAVRAEMAAASAEGAFSLRLSEPFGSDDDPNVRIFFPHAGVTDGALLRSLTDPAPFNLKLYSPDPEEWEDVLDELAGWGFSSCLKENRDSGPREITYGGAPPELIERLRKAIREKTAFDLQGNKQWPDTDMDIWFFLPRRKTTEPEKTAPAPEPQEDTTGQIELWAWPEGGDGEPVEPFVELTAERVRLGGVVLPRRKGTRHPLAPEPADFVHFCLDSLTGSTLEHIATSVLLREPCLLEGDTSTSKTSSILYLASLLGQPVARLNLNGQTDTGELVGRFVPQNLQNELPLTRDELQKESEWLEPESRMILERAKAANRALTRVEVQQIMANERMASLPWRWQDGLVVQAMKNGWWVILDEVNLGEPQVLERLNSVLESNPTLVLTENDSSVLGPGGTPVHADFRIFATMNPAEYAGRSVLSPAYRDRWRGYCYTARAGEHEYLDMMHLLVHGQQPDIRVRGRAYKGVGGPAKYAVLASLPNIDDLLESLARFHAALEHAAGQGSNGSARIGARRKERYVFTRRGILSLLDYLASPLAVHEGAVVDAAVRQALVRYYVGRVASAEDQAMVVQLLDAAGIGPNTWGVGQ